MGGGCSASCEREGRSAKVSPKAKEGVLEAKCRSMERLGTSVVEAKGTVCTKPQRDMTQWGPEKLSHLPKVIKFIYRRKRSRPQSHVCHIFNHFALALLAFPLLPPIPTPKPMFGSERYMSQGWWALPQDWIHLVWGPHHPLPFLPLPWWPDMQTYLLESCPL